MAQNVWADEYIYIRWATFCPESDSSDSESDTESAPAAVQPLNGRAQNV